jgi:Tfp pilus assembly protein PilO
MNRLSREKRNQLIIVVSLTVVVLGLIYFFLILPQKNGIQQLASAKTDAEKKLQQYEDIIKKADQTTADLQSITTNLANAETDIASGDIYAWTYDTLRRFKTTYHVDIPNIGQPSDVMAVDLLPGYPYKQIKLNLTGTAFYHDLGKFVADFENTFPHMRLVNLEIEPSPGVAAADSAEKLAFRVEVVILVKTAS